MDSQEQTLIHYGVLGMKWGVRKQRPKSSGKRSNKNSKTSSKSKTGNESNNTSKTKTSKSKTSKTKTSKTEASKSKKKVKDMTNAELEEAIKRSELEKRYLSLNSSNSGRIQTGKKIAGEIAQNSVKNIGSQLFTYVLGTAINKAAKQEIVNPKKGQKDK